MTAASSFKDIKCPKCKAPVGKPCKIVNNAEVVCGKRVREYGLRRNQ